MEIDAVVRHIWHVLSSWIPLYCSIPTRHNTHPTSDALVFIDENSAVVIDVQRSILARENAVRFGAVSTIGADEHRIHDIDARAVERLRSANRERFNRIDDVAAVFTVEAKALDVERVDYVFRFGVLNNACDFTKMAVDASVFSRVDASHGPLPAWLIPSVSNSTCVIPTPRSFNRFPLKLSMLFNPIMPSISLIS